MSETGHGSPEKRFSPEQERLITTARELLALPEAVEHRPRYTYRSTTKEEKLRFIVSKILRQSQSADHPIPDPLLNTPAIKTIEKVVTIRGLTRPDLGEGGWGGGVYLKQRKEELLEIGHTKEILTVYAEQTVGHPYGASEMSSYRDERPWQVNLLEVIEDSAEVARLQTDFDTRLAEAAE